VRKKFLADIKRIPLTNLVYIDEAGIDANETYQYGWAEKGERCYAQKFGESEGRVSFIGGLQKDKIIASMVFTGHCDRKVFEIYLEKCLVPQLTPGDVVIMDNASFHKSENIKQLINDARCTLKYLPAYSPDLNPIEHYWFPIKNDIRKQLDKNIPVYNAACKALRKMY
jgi:transposase